MAPSSVAQGQAGGALVAAASEDILRRVANSLADRWLAYRDTRNTHAPVDSTFRRAITGGAGWLLSPTDGRIFLVRGSPGTVIRNIQNRVGVRIDGKWGGETENAVLDALHRLEGTGWERGTPMTESLMAAAVLRFIHGDVPIPGHPEVTEHGRVVFPQRTEWPLASAHPLVDPGGAAGYLHAIQLDEIGNQIGSEIDLAAGAGTSTPVHTNAVQAVAQSTPDITSALNQQQCQDASGEWHVDQLQAGCYTPGTYVAPMSVPVQEQPSDVGGVPVLPMAPSEAGMFSGGLKFFGLLSLLGGIAWAGAKIGERVAKTPLARERARTNPRRHRR